MRRLFAPFLAILYLTTCPASWGQDRAVPPEKWPEIWFNPHSPLDWLDMWTDDAPWQHAAKRVNVLGIAHSWLLQATDAQILAIADFAKQHHMKLELESEVILHLPADTCADYVEGYTTSVYYPAEMAILKRLNVHLDIITMDEPIWFGHYSTCFFTVPDLVNRIKTNIAPILEQFPDIQIVEIEPVPAVTNFSDWRDILTSFRTLLGTATGRPIRDLQLDVDWTTPAWRPAVQESRTFAHEQNMGFGLFYNGDAADISNAAWVTDAQQHFETVEGTLGIIPEQAVFSTWYPYPQYNMPETSPTTQTWLIDNYFRERTALEVEFVGQGANGKLKTAQGKPIANATISGYVPGIDFSQPLPTVVVNGVVPATAAQLLLGLRLNAECNCQGSNDVLIGTLQYQETQGGSLNQTGSIPSADADADVNGVLITGETVGGSQVTRIIVPSTQSYVGNFARFPVTGGATFQLTIPAATVGGAGWYGHFILIWFDQNNNVLGGVTAVPVVGQRLMSTATTAADGSFALSKLPRVGPGAAAVTVEFAGDSRHRATTWSPAQ